MKKRLLALLVVLLCASSAQAQITFVAQSHTGGLASSNPTATEPTGTTSGDVMVACFGGNESSATAPTAPTGWTTLANNSINLVASDWLSWNLAYIKRGGSAPSLTWTGGAAGYSEVIIFTFRGVDGTTQIDSQSTTGGTGNTSGHNSDPPSTTAVSSSAMAVACGVMWQGNVSGYTASTGYTLPYSGAGEVTAFEYKSLSASGAENPSAVSGVSTGGADHTYWDGFTLTLKPAAAASCTPTLTLLGVGRCG